MIGVGDFKTSQAINKRVIDALQSGRVSYGPMCMELEERFAALHGAQFGVVMNSGTDALRVALHALKIEREWDDGDEVIVPSVTFVATLNVVLQVGLTPVIADVDPETANIDHEDVMRKLTPKTVCVMPVHLFGNPADVAKLRDLLPADVAIVEDACEAALAVEGYNPVGSIGDIGCFSFYAAHHIVGGVGGIAITQEYETARLMRSLVNHGRDTSYISMDDLSPDNIRARFRFEHIGYSCRMMELQAAMILPQLDDAWNSVRHRVANSMILAQAINGTSARTIRVDDADSPSWMMFPIFHKRKFDFMRHMEERGIETRETLPLTNQPCYEGMINELDFPAADLINRTGFYIPCHQYLSERDLERIVSALKEFLK